MNLFAKLALTVSISLGVPLHMQADSFAVHEQESVSISSVCKVRVGNAARAYALEVKRAPYAQWAVGLSAAAVVGTLIYKFYYAPRAALAEQQKLEERSRTEILQESSNKLWERASSKIEDKEILPIEKLNKEVDGLKTSVAYQGVLITKELLSRETKEDSDSDSGWLWWKNNTWSLSSMLLSQGVLGVGSAFLVTPALEALIAGKKMLPTSGGLAWYIADRTGYQRNVEDLVHYSQHEVLRNSFNSVVQLFVHDIEKIIGYLKVFKVKLNTAEGALVDRCLHYTQDLEILTNQLVGLSNDGAVMEDLRTKFFEINQMVASAQKFVKQNYR